MREKGAFDDSIKLFVAYIVDEKITNFGARWMETAQIKSIEQWEEKYNIESKLPSDYCRCLTVFVQKSFVFESGWTSHGNTREYTLCKSLKDFLFTTSKSLNQELQDIKAKHHFALPF